MTSPGPAGPVPCLSFPAVAGRVQRIMADPVAGNPHQLILGRSRTGKDWLVKRGILPLLAPMARVVVITPKAGQDPTWDGWGLDVLADDLPRTLDPPDQDAAPWWRVTLRPGSDQDRQRQAKRLLADLGQVGSVVVVLSDTGHLTESLTRGGLGLGGYVARLISEGGSNAVTVLACATGSSYLEGAVRTQAGGIWIGQTTGDIEQKEFADLAGLPKWARPQFAELPQRTFLYRDDMDGGGNSMMMAITKAPE